MKAELAADAQALLGEGPWWDVREQRLYWVDIEGRRLHVFDPLSGADSSINIGQRVGAVVGRKSGGVMLALQHGFYSLDLKTEQLTFIIDPESHLAANRFNDGKCDPAGRFWAGTMAVDETPTRGSLYCLDTELTVQRKIDCVSISNGLAWSLDETTMYFIDTPTRSVAAYDYDRWTGEISNRRVAFEIAADFGYPDGMTIDAEGMLWISFWDGGRVCRWPPDGGKLLETIVLPVSRPTSCVFGGAGLDTLYITSARINLDEKTLALEPLAGGLFCYRPGVGGVPAAEFAG